MPKMTINKDQVATAKLNTFGTRGLVQKYVGRGRISFSELARRTGMTESQLRHRYVYQDTYTTRNENHSVVDAIYAAVKAA